jgi:hypothetical protein
MKRLITCAALAAGMFITAGSSADAGLFWHRRVVYRPVVVSNVVVAPAAGYYGAPIQPVAPVVYTAAPVLYAPAPVVYRPAYYVPSPVYVTAPAAPVYVGW